MIQTTIQGIDFYAVTPEDTDYDPEPFSICVQIKPTNNDHTCYAICNNLACNTCPFATECEHGANLNKFIAKNAKDFFPELFI